MYLTKLILNPRARDARRDLNSPYNMHRTLQRAFPEGEPEANRQLFRIEPDQDQRLGRVVLSQSSVARPDWEYLKEPPFSEGQPYVLQVQGPKEVGVTFREGQELAFRLLGNPTKKQEGSRVALTNEEEYENWLHRKGGLHGYEVLQAHTHDYWINGDANGNGGYSKDNIPHFAVRYDGHLRVTDAEEMEETIESGIGPAKAFGFGLLSVAPAR